jgi:hypothetical protein
MPQQDPKDNEIVIGNGQNQKVFGPNTVIQVNLKTLLIVLGLLLSGLTTAWVNITNKIEKSNEKTQQQIEKISDKLETIRDQDLKQLRSDVDRMIGTSNNVIQRSQQEFRESGNVSDHPTTQVKNNKPELPR